MARRPGAGEVDGRGAAHVFVAGGSPARALALLQRDRLLRLHPCAEAARTAVVQDWFKDAAGPADRLMLAGTREEVRDLNLRAQALRVKAGQVGALRFEVDGRKFHLGDRVVFGRNDRLLGVRNGGVGELFAYDSGRGIASVRLDGGRSVYIPVRTYRALDLGYCLTTHKAQGLTVDRAYVLWSDTMQSRELTYVQASRARRMTRFHLTEAQAGPDFREALQDMERSVAKDLAVTRARRGGMELPREPGLAPAL